MACSRRVRVHVCVFVRVPSVHVSKEEVPGRHSLDTLLQQRCDGMDGWSTTDTVGPEVGYTRTYVHVAPGIAMYYKSAEECR